LARFRFGDMHCESTVAGDKGMLAVLLGDDGEKPRSELELLIGAAKSSCEEVTLERCGRENCQY
jgi:hypothetical protein